MGGFLSGLGALVGGAGQGAAQYGQQIRGILEERRSHFAELFTHMGDTAIDPTLRGQYYKLAGDLHAGKDMAKIAPVAIKAIENHTQGNNDLAQMAGGPPTPPTPIPSPAGLGQVPGTGTAAQPSTSPVQPSRQATPMTPAQDDIQPVTSALGSAPTAGMAAAIPPVAAASPKSYMGIPDIAGHPVDYYMQTPEGRKFIQPFVSNLADFSKTRGMADYRGDVLKNSGVMDNPDLPAWMKAALPLEAAGINVPLGGMAGLMTARQRNIDATTLTPEEKAAYGIPPEGRGHFTANVDFQGRPLGTAIQGWAGVGTAFNNEGNPFQYDKNDITRTAALTAPNGAAAQAPGITMQQNSPHLMTDVQGRKIFVSPKAAGMFGGVTGGIDPSMQPTHTTSDHLVTTTGPDGSARQEVVPFSSIRSKGPIPAVPAQPVGGGAAVSGTPRSAPTGSGGRIFPKPLTPEQQIKARQQIGQFDTAISRAQDVVKNIHLLDSMIDAGKMELQLHDGLLTNIVNRNMKLTPAEAKMVTDFNSLKESVNLIRNALGAGGFRGPEAFEALQAQRGKLLGNPEITRMTLQNLIQEMQNQVNPLRKPATGRSEIAPVSGRGTNKALKDMSNEELLKALSGGK